MLLAMLFDMLFDRIRRLLFHKGRFSAKIFELGAKK